MIKWTAGLERSSSTTSSRCGPTWEQFTGFLLDLIEDPTYRPFRNLQRYLAAMQSDQPIHRFVTYLEQLELEIPVLSQEMRAPNVAL